jgi:chemotaxis protein CheX
MSIEVALIDFPRLQEQIASRLLATQNVNAQRVEHTEAAARLDMFNLALFFWPDGGADAASRLSLIKSAAPASKVPIVLVTSEIGKRNAEVTLGKDHGEILVTPLQPHIVSRKLAQLLGIQKEPVAVKMDAAYINPFIEATADTLKQMAGMECERTGIVVRTDGETKGYISGTMGLSGTAEGFVAVTFNDELARKIVCQMLQINVGEESDADIRDGVGEFMNMIAGAAKAQLANTAHSFQLSLPNVIVGGPHSVGQFRGVPVIVVEFKADGSPFEIMVCLIPKKK